MTDVSPVGDDRESFAAFYREVVDPLRGYVYSLSPEVDADAVANEALTRTFVRWSLITGSRRAWVFKVAHNLVRSAHRGVPVIPVSPGDLTDRPGNRFAGPELSYDVLELLQAIATLPKCQQEPILLAAQELSPLEIADVLEMKPRTVSKYLYRARVRLARLGLLDRRPPVPVDPQPVGERRGGVVDDSDAVLPGIEHTRQTGTHHA